MNKQAILTTVNLTSDQPYWKITNDKIRVRAKFVIPESRVKIVGPSPETLQKHGISSRIVTPNSFLEIIS